jgi:hypothetical protein
MPHFHGSLQDAPLAVLALNVHPISALATASRTQHVVHRYYETRSVLLLQNVGAHRYATHATPPAARSGPIWEVGPLTSRNYASDLRLRLFKSSSRFSLAERAGLESRPANYRVSASHRSAWHRHGFIINRGSQAMSSVLSRNMSAGQVDSVTGGIIVGD